MIGRRDDPRQRLRLVRPAVRRAPTSAAVAAALVDAPLTQHAIAGRKARRLSAAWWMASGFVFGAATAAALMLWAARAGVPLAL